MPPYNGTSEQRLSKIQEMGIKAKQACASLQPLQSQQLWETTQSSMTVLYTASSHAVPQLGTIVALEASRTATSGLP